MLFPNLLLLLACIPPAPIHDGPDPIGSWRLNRSQVVQGRLKAMLGIPGAIKGSVEFERTGAREALWFDGKTSRVVLADDFSTSGQKMPEEHMTLEVWAAVNQRQQWGGLVSVLQDNGNAEKGWILGFNARTFLFGLATVGADDGDGKMTYLKGKTPYREGQMYHIVGTYDGKVQRLYVNGKLDAESTVQSGKLLYPKSAPLVIGGYLDRDEDFYFGGRIRSVRMFDQAGAARWVQGAFEHLKALTKEAPVIRYPENFSWVVHPYLQWPTQKGMTVRWETTRPSTAKIEFAKAVRWEGKDKDRVAHFESLLEAGKMSPLGEFRFKKLTTDTAYYYRLTVTDDRGRKLTTPILSFQTAPPKDSPFAFAVISDTQRNPKVTRAVAAHAWALRPNFLLHPGDLVDTGSNKQEWVGDFFGSMKPLLERVPVLPVLGNHEQDTHFYYDYMSLPAPEYFYKFQYANAEFFMLDSNRKVGPDSEQYLFLEKALRASKAQWKIVCYHHPAYSSDENDYGDTWSGPGTRGDLRTRELVRLFDRYGVDIVWNGHIHSYERTWPLRDSTPVPYGSGTLYMVTGGGGGHLESPGPIRPKFQNTVHHGHHFCFVAVNGRTLEMKAYDQEGRLFDSLKIEQKRK